MNSYVKLIAKKKLLKNTFKCFLVSFLPYVTIVLLTVLNYYLYNFLKTVNFDFNSVILSYENYLKATLLTFSIVLSFLFFQFLLFASQKFFFCKQLDNYDKRITFKQYLTCIVVSVLKFYLSLAWSVVFYFPTLAVGVAFYYSISAMEFNFNLTVTLFVAVVTLFVIGSMFLYVTLKRYSMCNYVIFTGQESESIKVIEKSIVLMENHLIDYSLYCFSFAGWILSCILIVPIIYVLPYIKIAKCGYFKAVTKPNTLKQPQKPIVFYIQKRVER